MVGHLIPLLKNQTSEQEQFRHDMNRIMHFFWVNNVEVSVAKRILEYKQYMWQRQKGYDENTILEHGIPPSLRMEVKLKLCLESLRKIHLFEDMPSGIMRGMINSMVAETFSPNTTIVQRGTINRELYVQLRGIAEETVGGLNPKQLGPGSVFGLDSFTTSFEISPSTVVTVDFVDVFFITHTKFMAILQLWPSEAKDILNSIEAYSQQRHNKKSTKQGGSKNIKVPT